MTGRRAKLWAFVFNVVRKHGANEARILAAQGKFFSWKYQAGGGIVVRTQETAMEDRVYSTDLMKEV